MSTYRICLVAAFVLLGACATPPERSYSPPPLPTADAPTPVPSSVAIAPAAEPVPPQVAPAPEAALVAPSAVNSEPAEAAAAPPSPVVPMPPSKPAPSTPITSATVVEPPVKPVVKPMRKSVAEVGTAAVEKPEKAVPARAMLQGRVSLAAGRGQTVAAGDLTNTLVYFVPASGGARVKPGHFTVYTHNRDFNPEAISVPQGSTVTFINLDDVRHNVFSVTPGSDFNLGYQASGEKASHAFAHAGIVLISCNVHHSMELDMLVVPTPYSAKVNADGSFTLKDLPAGSGKLYFWNPRAPLSSQAVTLPMSGAVAQKLVASKPAMDTQLNTGGRQ